MNLLERGIKPSDILSREAFENAITTVIALEGSTNAVLHLMAIAHAARIPLALDDFTRVGKARAGTRRHATRRHATRCRN